MEKIKLYDDISISSFQVGLDLADSIISIFNQSFNIVNVNDAKILPISRKHFSIPNLIMFSEVTQAPIQGVV